MPKHRRRPSPDQHREIGAELLALRTALDAAMGPFRGRIRGPSAEAWLSADATLHRLARELGDTSAGEPAKATTDASSPSGRRAILDEHRRLGAELSRIRERAIDLVVRLALHFPKSSTVGLASHQVGPAIDRLRLLLDSQAADELGDAFDVKLFYPGGDDA